MNAAAAPADAPGRIRRLIWFDCASGAGAGVTVVALHRTLASWEGLPTWLVLANGAANLAYATYGFSLAIRPRPSRRAFSLLAGANMAWATVCLAALVAFATSVGPLGVAHLAFEAAHVGVLGAYEWRRRDWLPAR